MKIGITCYPTYGGSGAIATGLGLSLAKRGHEIHFVSYAQPFRLASGFHERVFYHEVVMESYPLFEHAPYPLALAVSIHDVVRKHDLDLMHVHYAIPHATSAWIAREMLAGERNLPIVTTLHGTDITLIGMQPSFQAITRFSILRSDAVTAVSSFLAEETVKGFGVAPGSIEVIPNFVDTELFGRKEIPCHRAALAPGGEAILMHVSNFRPVKRIRDVIEIFAAVRARIPARLVLVGDGPERGAAIERARALGVDDGVLCLGKHDAVDELLPCADLFLLPSETESFGLAALESLASGTPVIASEVGGLPEVIEDGVTGILRPLGDVRGMAEAAISLLQDPPRREEMSRAGRARAEELFSIARVVPRYEALYARVLERER